MTIPPGKRTGKPLLFDKRLQPKQAFWGHHGRERIPSARCRPPIAFKGNGRLRLDGSKPYPIGRPGTYQVVYDDDSPISRVSTSPEAAIEISLGDESYSYDADESGCRLYHPPGRMTRTAYPSISA